ncbi:MAG: DUF1592 domain-containing protein [Planctomycetota bacterium]
MESVRRVRRLLAFALVVISTQVNAGDLRAKLGGFLETHCYDCHGPEKQKGEYRFDTLTGDLGEIETLEIWQNILDQLNLGEMPPKKRPQPSREETATVVRELTGALKAAYEAKRSTGAQTVLRRLNRHELRNTLRDLLYLEGADFRPDAAGSRLIDNNGNGSVERTGADPLRFFPEDEEEDGFFNLGDQLVMSDFLLKLTLGAVEETLDLATHLEARPKVRLRRFASHLETGRGGHVIESVAREFLPYDLMATGYTNKGRLSPTKLRAGVGLSARYRITVEVSAHNRDHPWSDMVELAETDPFQLALNMADMKQGGLNGVTSTPLALWSVPDDGETHTFEHEVWLDESWAPWIGWENGPIERGFRAERVVEKYLPSTYVKRPDKKLDQKAHENWPRAMARALFRENDGYLGPHLRIHGLSVEPLIESWPPRSHTALYGSGSGEEAEIRTLLTTFAERAFRRPVDSSEIEPYVALVLSHRVEPIVILPGGMKDLRYEVYDGKPKWGTAPDFASREPDAKGEVPQGLIDLKIAKRKENFGLAFTGKIEAPRAGEYVFEIAADDRARILVDGVDVLAQRGAGYLGVQTGPGDNGILIVRTVEGSPASRVLKKDDLIVAIAGEKHTDPGEFSKKIQSYRAGDEVEFTVLRKAGPSKTGPSKSIEQKIKVKLAGRSVGLYSVRKRKVSLTKGPHRIRVEYAAWGAPNRLRVGWSGPGMGFATLSVDSLRGAQKNQRKAREEVPPLVRAMQDGYAAILCSPQFLYLKETANDLDAFELAARLSYFLWSSMPDETLYELARSGELRQADVRRVQVERMLKDPRAAAFVRHFSSAWLRLDKLGKMPPSGGDYQFYKNLKVEPMLLEQVTTYFREILESNGNIEEFIDSDFTYMNQVLAKWIYKREGIRGARLRKVALGDPRRGGIFTLPGVMTATANGVDTSPVVRGTWVLENVLGTPPAPPPPDVEPLPTDTRKAKTIREQLELHRKHEACNSCHRKIDPLGFAFENFDVVGRWRDRYRRARESIDSSTVLSSGRKIADIVEFKQMLKERKALIVRCLTEKMLTYATGRRLEAVDRGEIDRIARELAKGGDRLRDLVHLVIGSEIFLRK